VGSRGGKIRALKRAASSITESPDYGIPNPNLNGLHCFRGLGVQTGVLTSFRSRTSSLFAQRFAKCSTPAGGATSAFDDIVGLVLCVVLPACAQQGYVVGAWNLEHFHEGAKRGFPEGSIRARRTADYQFIASIIKNVDAKILVLSELNGEVVVQTDEDGSFEAVQSPELNKLIGMLGPTYDYVIADSGGSQRIAVLFDTKVALDEIGRAAFSVWRCPDVAVAACPRTAHSRRRVASDSRDHDESANANVALRREVSP
jgi:hypothetical protein